MDERALLDFGLARTEGSQQLTQTTTQIGSLPYLPPEQLDESTRIPSERQDIYSLGVTLYELLALRSPFLGPTPETTRQRIRDGRVAALRTRNSQVDWELETVCLTALAEAPERRYPNATALLRDLANVRDRRPIEAKRASAWIRGRRWLQRHPTLSAAVASSALLLLIAAVLFGIYQGQARHHAETLRLQAETARTEAERRAAEADAVTEFLVELFQHASPEKTLGTKLPVRTLLEQGAMRIGSELDEQHSVRARLLGTFARVYSWLGETDRAIGFYTEALSALDAVPVGEGSQERFWLRLGRISERTARGNYQQAEQELGALRELVARSFPERGLLEGRVLRAQGVLEEQHGRYNQATDYYVRSLELIDGDALAAPGHRFEARQALAVHYRTQHRYQESQQLLEECLRVEDVPHDHPSYLTSLRYAAENHAALGEYDAARRRAEEALVGTKRVFGDMHPSTARALRSAAFVLRESGDNEAAIELLKRVDVIAQEYASFSPLYYSKLMDELGRSYHMMGRFSEAKASFEAAKSSLAEAFVDEHILGGYVDLHLAETLSSMGRVREAAELARKGAETVEELAEGSRFHAQALGTLAWIATQIQDMGTARRQADRAVAFAREHPQCKVGAGAGPDGAGTDAESRRPGCGGPALRRGGAELLRTRP